MISDVTHGTLTSTHMSTVRYGTIIRPGFLFYVCSVYGTGIMVQWSTYDVRYSVQHSVREAQLERCRRAVNALAHTNTYIKRERPPPANLANMRQHLYR